MNNFIQKLLLVSLFFTTFVLGDFASAIKKQKFLTPEEAFKVSAVLKDDAKGAYIETRILIGDKIHVYDDDTLQYTIISPEVVKLAVDKPASHDFDGDKVYEKELVVNIPVKDITSKVKGDYTLEIALLGCSDAGICYQPIKKTFDFKGVELGVWNKISKLAKEGNAGKIVDVLVNESTFFVLLIFFIFGLLLSLTPCIFPMIPILSSIIISQQSDDEKPSMGKAFFTSLVYVLAMALTYTLVGLIAGMLGADLQAAMQNPWVLTIFAGVFIALAFSLFGYFEIGLPASWQSKINKASDGAQGKGILGTAIMGALSALIVGPCTAAPISGAVIFISQTGDALLGGAALFVMSMGMGMPLLLVGLGAGKFMPRPGGWMTAVSQVFGVMMLGLAIFMLSRILPGGFTMILWSLLFMGTALYMGVFESKVGEGAMKLMKLLAMVFLVYGIILFVGAVSGAKSMFSPLQKFTSGTVVQSALSTSADSTGHLGYSVARLMKEVKASDKPVVVDFGKDSCTACTELEEITFPHPKVQEQLKGFTFIKVDLTANNEEDKALLKEYGLFGTPNIIFFEKDNTFMPEKSLTGFVPPEDFAKHLERVLK